VIAKKIANYRSNFFYVPLLKIAYVIVSRFNVIAYVIVNNILTTNHLKKIANVDFFESNVL
jgi:hypothetical protein